MNEITKNNLKYVSSVDNKLVDYDDTISKMRTQFLTAENAANFALTSAVNDRILNQTKFVDDNYITKVDAANTYVTNNVLRDTVVNNKIYVDKQDKRILDISNRATDIDDKLRGEYASKTWCQGEFATGSDMTFVKGVQNNILTNYVKKTDLNVQENITATGIKKLENNIGDLKTYTDNTFATTDALNNKVEQNYTPLALHNNVSQTVNKTLIALNDALLKTIRNDGDTATYTKLKMYDSQIEDVKDTVDDVKTQMNGITENTIERNEMVLGNFRLKGTEPGNYIKVFNKEGTVLSGGMMLQNLATTNLGATGISEFNGMINLGKSDLKPVLINGFADVSITNGSVKLTDANAKHQISGNLDVNNIVTKTLQIGDTKFDLGYIDSLEQKIKNIENRMNMIETQ
jgi:hypothetical protein